MERPSSSSGYVDAASPPTLQLFDRVMTQAFLKGASDIHMEPQRDKLYIRYRIDGSLQTVLEIPKESESNLISSVKVLASLDIFEKRRPQDGKYVTTINGAPVNVRVSTIPCGYGEKVVLRIFDKTRFTVGLEQLGVQGEILLDLEELLQKPWGMILVTGPTGSGKTTTLYAILNRLASLAKNIVTLEDPVEADILESTTLPVGITQVSINPKADFDFASGLRSILRQDPDIIMVGEIRDQETAEIAISTSLTGRLVFSTLHTNDAAGAVARLIDMGVEPFLVSSSLSGIVNQRLIRVICEICKEPYDPPRDILDKLKIPEVAEKIPILYRGKGCEKCQYTGYQGRKGIFELMKINESLKDVISGGVSASTIRRIARSTGMNSLREVGLHDVAIGVTTLEEICRVLFVDEQLEATCPHCGHPTKADAVVCPHCMKLLKNNCIRCERILEPEWVVCPYCGERS
ncbi:MAG: Flp pilus assembly complex ATPase component TadA [Armatimonadetes bacterium]|nr:Flp pilus assembly complex ATPase component TadA [Armatimonadota bacterium]